MINLGLDPNGFNKKAAKLASSLYLEAPIAKAKPPKNRMITGDAKQLKTDL